MLAGAASLTCGEAYGMRVAGRRLALPAPAAGIGRTIFFVEETNAQLWLDTWVAGMHSGAF